MRLLLPTRHPSQVQRHMQQMGIPINLHRVNIDFEQASYNAMRTVVWGTYQHQGLFLPSCAIHLPPFCGIEVETCFPEENMVFNAKYVLAKQSNAKHVLD